MRYWTKSTEQKRGYDAAAYNRILNGFKGTNASEDSLLRQELRTLRERSRDLARNNEYVKNAIRIISTNVVGTGIPFQAQVKKQRGGDLNKTLNDAIESLWWDWTKADSCHLSGEYTFQQIEQTIMKVVPKNGETFVRLIRHKVGKSKVPLALQLLEADMLDEKYNDILTNGNEVRMGIEKDSDGRRVAYYFFNRHPGDYSPLYSYQETRRVRVDAKDIIPLFIPDDENQTRAAPWFTSAMKRLHQVQNYEEATVVGHRARASVMAFIETPDNQLQGDAVQGADQVFEFTPGAFFNLPNGSKINVPNLGVDGNELDPFMKYMLRGQAVGIGISYESYSKDYQGATYSSARQALLEDRDGWRIYQWWFIRAFHEKVLEAWLDAVYLQQVLDLPNYITNPEFYTCVKWQPRGWSWIDPEKEVAADKAAVRSGFKTVSQVLTESGSDIEELVDQRVREMKLFKAAGMVLDTDPAQVTSMGLEQPGLVGPTAESNPPKLAK